MKTKKKLAKEFRAPHVGFSLGLATCRGGIHGDKRLKRLNTRSQKNRQWQKEMGV